VGAFMAAAHGYTFAAIGSMYPRQGADYIAATSTFGRRVGFYASWTLIVSSAFVAGALIVFIPQSALPVLAQPLTLLFGSQLASSVSSYLGTGRGSLIGGTLFLGLTFLTMILNRKKVLKILSFGLLLGLVAWLLMLLKFFQSN
jgi:amino acid transporter